MDERLVKYVKDNSAKGYPIGQIKQAMLTRGWREEDADAAIKAAGFRKKEVKQRKKYGKPQIITVIMITVMAIALILFFFIGDEGIKVESEKRTPLSGEEFSPEVSGLPEILSGFAEKSYNNSCF